MRLWKASLDNGCYLVRSVRIERDHGGFGIMLLQLWEEFFDHIEGVRHPNQNQPTFWQCGQLKKVIEDLLISREELIHFIDHDKHHFTPSLPMEESLDLIPCLGRITGRLHVALHLATLGSFFRETSIDIIGM